MNVLLSPRGLAPLAALVLVSPSIRGVVDVSYRFTRSASRCCGTGSLRSRAALRNGPGVYTAAATVSGTGDGAFGDLSPECGRLVARSMRMPCSGARPRALNGGDVPESPNRTLSPLEVPETLTCCCASDQLVRGAHAGRSPRASSAGSVGNSESNAPCIRATDEPRTVLPHHARARVRVARWRNGIWKSPAVPTVTTVDFGDLGTSPPSDARH